MKIRITTADMFRRGFFRCHLCGDYDGKKICDACLADVLKFIDAFSDMKEHYLSGKCYWFAVILRERFGGRIFYNQIDNHWACLIGGHLFDASGEIDQTGFEQWPGIIKDDTPYYNRLLSQCINYTE